MAVGDEGSDPSAREIRLGDPKGILSMHVMPVRLVAESPPLLIPVGDGCGCDCLEVERP